MPLSQITNDWPRNLLAWLLCSTLLLPSIVKAGPPYRPSSNSEVLENLPRVFLADRDQFTQLRRQLAASPNDQRLAVAVANRYLQMGNQVGDPRFYGYARAALTPWWETRTPDSTILQLRAKLKEKDHLYDQALSDLQLLVQQQPRHTQAWIELANIYRVQGRYAEARQACDSLSEFAGDAQVLLSRVPILAVTGQAEEAYRTLERVIPKAKQMWPDAVPWMRIMQAKIAWSLGNLSAAEEHFRAGLANNPEQMNLLRSYADFLMDQSQNDEAVSLLRDYLGDNGILLRAAIAAKRNGQTSLSAQWQAELASRFHEIRLRGNQPHGRFETRYELELRGDPSEALKLALANWEKQKETRDTRNVLEAALAAKAPRAAQPVRDFLQSNQTQDATLNKLLQQLESL